MKREPCKNPNCVRGREQITIVLGTPATNFVRSVLKPLAPPPMANITAPCPVCRPKERAKWEASIRKARQRQSTTSESQHGR